MIETTPLGEVEYLFNHIFLPLRLPGKSDDDAFADKLLLKVLECAQSFSPSLRHDQRPAWNVVVESIRKWHNVYDTAGFIPESATRAIHAMTNGESLLVHIKSQNAALILHKQRSGTIFEMFEVSPTTNAVLKSHSALTRTFPARSVMVSDRDMKEQGFLNVLVEYMHKLATEPTHLSLESVVKANAHIKETRQSPHPRLVTQWFFAWLATQGRVLSSTVTVTKRTRDDVSWSDALKPWRRSSMWLCIRVGLQLMLERTFHHEEGRYIYKAFMLSFICHVNLYIHDSLSSLEDFHIIRVKLAQRQMKLGTEIPVSVDRQVTNTLQALRTTMESEWNAIQTLERRQVPRISLDRLDRHILLANSRSVLQDIIAHYRGRPTVERHLDEGHPIKEDPVVVFDPHCLPHDSNFLQPGNNEIQVLHAFNVWVENNLEAWSNHADHNASTCTRIKNLIRRYYDSCSTTLSRQPELMSVAILVMLELWVVLDKIAVTRYPLLKEFSPELPANCFRPLRLPQYKDMYRLSKIECYLSKRHTDANSKNPSIFDNPCHGCFGMQYFDQSPELKSLLVAIDTKTEEDKAEIKASFQDMKQQYENLLRKAQPLRCKNRTVNRNGMLRWVHDNRDCTKCNLIKKANKMSIVKYEEPLPPDSMLRKSVVFELQPGETFVAWRDATQALLQDVFSTTITPGDKIQTRLEEFKPLLNFYTHADRRVGLASSKKAFSKSHYIRDEIGTSIEPTLFVPHGLEHRFIDNKEQNIWIAEQVQNWSLARLCRCRLPEGPYSVLLETIHTSRHSQNNVIARQSKCPPTLSLREFIAFGSLRAGEKLQWINILRSLLVGDISLNSSSTIVLLEQTIHEVGTASSDFGDVLRVAHQELRSAEFCRSLLAAADTVLINVKSNWKECNTLYCCLVVIMRALSLRNTYADELFWRGMDMIRSIRRIALKWALQLANQCLLLRTHEKFSFNIKELQGRVLSAALLAKTTWRVEDQWRHILLSTKEDLTDYVAISILVADYHKLCKGTKTEHDSALRWNLLRDHFTVLEVENTIRSLCHRLGNAISTGIQTCWTDLEVETTWHFQHGPRDHWIVSTTMCTKKPVHWNIVTGVLLVNGKPVSILPENYTESLIYKQLFGDSVLNVIAADVTWMEFMTTSLIAGSRVYFGLRGKGVVIQSAIDGFTYELLSRSIFQSDLPVTIVNQSQPWLCLDDGHLEFREQDSPWRAEPRSWIVRPSQSQQGLYSMTRQQQALVDTTRPYGLTICRIFQHFEEPKYLEISFDQEAGLKIDLPRYHLTFSLRPETGYFRCQELAAEIDQDQSIGSLHGLQSRLVLSSTNASEYDPKRLVLIPYGVPLISSPSSHVVVKIETGDSPAVKFFQYRIDQNLCKIDAEGNLEGHLFKAYLHAVTTNCLLDTLTGRTGTEEALEALRDSVTLTSIPISEIAAEILTRVSQLTPLREFYPDSKSRTVQRTRWQYDLPSIAQYDGYSELATDIATHSIMANFLYTCEKQISPEYAGDQELRERAQHRASNYMVFDMSTTTPTEDCIYRGRDRENERNWTNIYDIAFSVSSWSQPMTPYLTNLYDEFEKCNSIVGFSETFEPAGLADLITIDLKIYLPAMMKMCISATQENANRLALQLSLIAFGNAHLVPLVRTLVSFAVKLEIKNLGLPADGVYDLTDGHVLLKEQVVSELEPFLRYRALALQQHQAVIDGDDGRVEEMNVELQTQQDLVYIAMKQAWPMGNLVLPEKEELSGYKHAELCEVMHQRFTSWKMNESLYQKCLAYAIVLSSNIHYQKLSPAFNVQIKPEQQMRSDPFNHCASLLHSIQRINVVEWSEVCPQLTGWDMSLREFLPENDSDDAIDQENAIGHTKLKQLLNRMEQTAETSVYHTVKALQASHCAFEEQTKRSRYNISPPDKRRLQLEHSKAVTVVQGFLESLKVACAPSTKEDEVLQVAGLWRDPDTRSLLQLLKLDMRSKLSKDCQDILLDFARAISAKQRLARLLYFAMTGDKFALEKEVENDAHSAWDVREHIDWLLLELQNDFLIRPIQVRVAQELMLSTNEIVQLGMGEGKTSVILPMVITALSDGTRFMRVLVIKSLANEMLRSLSQTLSGLIGRPVFYLPFSRSTPVTTAHLTSLSVIRQSVKDSRGVLLALPEHINSFRLMGNDRVVANERGVMERMLGTQKGFDNSAVDILDECDEILHPRNELVYTSGSPKPLQGTPDRWCILLDLLQLVDSAAGRTAAQFQTAIEYTSTSLGTFPHIRLLKEDGYAPLLKIILDDIKRGSIAPLQLNHYNERIVNAVIDFISKQQIETDTFNTVRQSFRKQSQLDCLYLLRGMLANGHLQAALEKRWFVNYGLDRSRRCMSAVPYRAKSTPAAAAEFAQPDMMILFTALSYYYTGLEAEEIRHCLSLLLKSADPAEEYSKWISAAAVPKEYRSVSAINPESDQCVEQLYSMFKMNRDVVSFFLKQVVFPREAKEFPQKLCSSAWDLCARGSNGTVSGFSGTCDVLLPLTVVKKDIKELRHFDAAVLVDLLKDRNDRYIYAGDVYGRKLDTDALLQLISDINDKTRPSVIIDVGAQILDMNKDVARQWLRLRQDKMACVYFNDENEKTVFTRSGVEEPWKSSPWKEQVQKCLIFLDEFHTRGTDFQLPDNFTAAVLLGPKLSKDTLVQACMRMRKLTFSQSLIFFGPPEVDTNMRTLLKRSPSYTIQTSDIVEYTILQSCAAQEQQRPLWIDRGLAWVQRRVAFDKYVQNGGRVLREPYLRAVLEDESHEVSRLYAPATSQSEISHVPSRSVNKDDSIAQELLKQWQGCRSTDTLSCFAEQEQEREILHEVEQEREVERPDQVNARVPYVNEELHDIIRSNRLAHKKPSTPLSAFDILSHSSLRHKYSSSQWPPYLLATQDFLYPIKIADGSDIDDFLRPVNWLLVLKGLPHIILISCHEANAYMDDLKACSVATLLPYHPLVHKESGTFDSLNVYQISGMPDVASVDRKAHTALRLYAGQLYFNNFQEYTDFCLLLGLWDGKMSLKFRVDSIDDSNYIPYKMRSATSGWTGKWKSNPVEMIKRFIGMRTQHEEWDHTHVGRVLNGQRLTENDFC